MAGIVHFSAFFRYMEVAEHAMFRAMGYSVVTDINGQRYGWPRVRAECDFSAPLRFEDTVEIELLVRDVRPKSLELEFRFHKIDGDQKQQVARGSVVTVCVQRDAAGKMKSVAIPPEIAGQLEAAPPSTTE